MNLNALKNFDVMNPAVEELIAVSAELSLLANGYANRGLVVPEWIADKSEEVDSEIKSKVKAERMAAIKKMKAQRSALMTNEEKRKLLDTMIAEAEAQL
jgi:uncharacterized protein YdcH (DUF465 family)